MFSLSPRNAKESAVGRKHKSIGVRLVLFRGQLNKLSAV